MRAGGYFPPESSVLYRVQSERSVGLIYGQRALMLGAMSSPLSYYGTSAHTAAKTRPFQRLVHTAKMFETVFFGTTEEADKALAFVLRLHGRVKGTTEEALGPWPAGTPYSALDPDLMLKGVVAPTFDSARAVYEALVRPLSHGERDSMWRDYLRFGELFGMPREAAPATYSGFRRWWEAHLESDQVFLTEEAREVGYETGFGIPVPRLNRPGMAGIEFLLRGLLPERARELYGIAWSGRDQRTFDAMAFGMRRGAPITPGRLRRGSCDFFLDVVARTERKLVRSGQAGAMFRPQAPNA
jgi:uncharacterized protein (DUF2236 family)